MRSPDSIPRLVAALLLALVPVALAGCGGGSEREVEIAPPLSGTIGVVSEGELWLLAADGSDELRLRFGADWAGSATLSPSGRRIVFDTTNGIWICSAIGGEAAIVPGLPIAFERPNFDASWSPDGRSVAFAGERGIYRVDLEGDSSTGSGSGAARPTARLLFADAGARDPEWSPDGSQIAFVRELSEGSTRGRSVWLVGAGGSGPRLIASGQDPSFSPDGARIAFTRKAAVFVVRLPSGRPRLLVNDGYDPAWAPGGSYLAFKRQIEECGEAGCREQIKVAYASGRRRWGEIVSTLERDFFASGEMGWTAPHLPKPTTEIRMPEE